MTEAVNQITTPMITAALLVFLGSYALIISEKVHRTSIALFGGAAMIMVGIFFGFFDQEKAVASVDFNTIGLLVGMMIIVALTKDTGLFQYVAVWSAKLAKGDPWKIMILFALITAIFSAFLANVTTVLLIVPMTFVVCDNLKINPMPFLLVEIFMSNIGGTATLIGDPPNIMIGSAANLSFLDFINNLAPIIVIIFVATMFLVKIIYGKQLKAKEEDMLRIMNLKESETIKDKKLLIKSLIVLGIVILGFFLQGMLGVEGATIAIFGAGLLLVLDNKNPERAIHEVEWTTIFFFLGLFILVGGLEQVGAISWAAEKMIALTGGSLKITVMMIMWGGAFFSAFVDNIPFVAAMIPLVHDMGSVFQNLNPIWWSLALGACLGGNGTLVGASANLVVADLAGKSGYKIGFSDFLKIGMGIMVFSVAISTVYVWFRYL